MSSFGKTKKEIIGLLSKRQQTLTDLSKELDLSPSTVKQHLEELEAAGAILPVENEFIRRWKYYKPNPEFGMAAANQGQGGIGRVFPYAVGAAIIIGIAYLLVFGFSGHGLLNSAVTNNGTSATSLMSVRLTDPPSVPPGTDALYIRYSSVELHVVGNNTWVRTNGNGTLDLMSLINSSQVISNAYLGSNAMIDGVRLNVTNATININSTDYGVSVANPNLKATFSQPEMVGLNQSVLLDFSPTVATVYGINGTSFVLVPALKAVFSSGGTRAPGKIGTVTSLEIGERTELYEEQPNLTVLNASLVSVPSGVEPSNQMIRLTLRNNGNSTVDITQVIIQGNLQFYLNAKMQQPAVPPSLSTTSVHGWKRANMGTFSGGQEYGDGRTNISIPWMPTPFPVSPVGPALRVGQNFSINNTAFRGVGGMLMFGVEANGTLSLPGNKMAFISSGYQLQPGQSVTLTFNGTIGFPEGGIEIGLVPNDTYRAVVVSSLCPVANFNLKAQ